MRRVVLTFVVIAPILAVAVWSLSPWLALAIVFMSHMILLYATLSANVQWLGPVVTHFATTRKEVWLTLDDGPDGEDTPEILRILAAANARATFFVIGDRVRQHPELIRAILAGGHTVANHSDTHPSAAFWRLGRARIAAQIDGCNSSIETASGTHPLLFRAPVGMKNLLVHPLLEPRGMKLIGWTVRGFDTVSSDPDSIITRLKRGIVPGAIVLLHEGHVDRAGRHFNPEVLRRLLSELSGEGYEFVVPASDALLCGALNTSR